MDKKIEKKSFRHWKVLGVVLASIFLFAATFYWFNREKQAHIPKDRLTIKTVEYDHFEDMVLFNGTVEPLNTVFINTIESGAVRAIFAEDGNFVEQGEPLVELYNPNTELNYLTQETAIIEQINNLSNTRIAIKNQQLNLDRNLLEIDYQYQEAARQFDLDKQLFEAKALAQNEYATTEGNFSYQRKQQDLIRGRVEAEKTERAAQLARLNQSIEKMERSLEKLRSNKENFTVKAAAAGKLSSFSPVIGKSYQGGESLGKIDLMSGYKIVAKADEYYISSIVIGQAAQVNFGNEIYHLIVQKVLPEVINGKFEVELVFQENAPTNLQRGMSLPIKVYLSDQDKKAYLLPKGGFYQSSGGQFVFVVTKENRAEKRFITIGKSNPYYFEVLDGLQEGEEVVVSNYDNYKEMQILNLH